MFFFKIKLLVPHLGTIHYNRTAQESMRASGKVDYVSQTACEANLVLCDPEVSDPFKLSELALGFNSKL